jgi:uncharacterized ion transporter superfamily protein YfcC
MEANKNGSLIERKVFITTLLLLVLLIAAAGITSYVVPAGRYVDGPKGERVYEGIESSPVPLWKILLSPILSLTGANGPKIIVLTLFVLIIGGSFTVMNECGILPRILAALVERFSAKKRLFIVITVFLFSFLGSTLGLIEEIIPLILVFIPIALRMGWDPLTGIALPFLSAGFGFSAAMFNPFTIGTAQKLAGLPLFSGLGLRVVLFVITTALVTLFLLRHTQRIEGRGPRAGSEAVSEVKGLSRGGDSVRPVLLYMGVCFALIVAVVGLGTQIKGLQDISFPLIALIFLIMGLGAGFISGAGAGMVFRSLGKGAVSFAPAVVMILMAAAVGYLIEIGKTLDTIIHAVTPSLGRVGKGPAAILLYLVHMGINFFVPSGTGKAVLTMPILIPLGDVIGLTRQTVVLAFQFGDGFSNLLWPSNPMLMVALGLWGVSYKKWLLWSLPLQILIFVICLCFLLFAVWIGYQ